MDLLKFIRLCHTLATSAEYPPMKFTPTSCAALSRVFAMVTKSSVLQAAPPTRAIGVTEIRLFTIGNTELFSEISSPVDTRFFASVVILL